MTFDEALDILKSHGDVQKAAEAAAWHKVDRAYLGVAPAQIDALAREWRQTLDLDTRLELADALWHSGIHDAMMAAAKLLEQARIRPDDSAAWEMICAWADGFSGAAVSDQAAIAGQKRLVADPSRIKALKGFVKHENLWTRRAALMMALPWAKMNNPKEGDLEIRELVLGWAADLIQDRNFFMQKAISGWIADLSRHDAERARAFVEAHGAGLKSYARKESERFL